MKDKRKDHATKAFEPSQASSPNKHALVFLRREKLLSGSDGELTEQPLACTILTRYTDVDENLTSSPHHGVYSGH